MIQIYSPSNKNFDMNGEATLTPISCVASFILNDVWELTLEVPLDDYFRLVVEDAVVSVPTPYGERQLYRIYSKTKTNNSVVAYALPIALDARKDCFLFDVRPINKTGQDALNIMLAGSKYNATSNIVRVNTSYYIQKNFIEALNGEDENSFISRWGGEIAYQNYTFIVNDKLGSDNGLRIEFGFNLTGIEEAIDMSEVVTRIIPKAYNGYTLPNNETVDSPLINTYATDHYRTIEYSNIKLRVDAQENDEVNGVIVCDTFDQLYEALRTQAKLEYTNGLDLPSITYKVDLIDLSKTDLYKDYKDLLVVNLGDTGNIKHRRLGVTTKARVIELTYNCLTRKVESLTLGDYKANYFNNTTDIIHSASKVIDTANNTLMAEKISGVLNLLNTALKGQKNVAQRQDVRAILFEDLDVQSPTFGALCIGTLGIQLAKKRNATNTDWQWGTAIDFQSINADYLITGILTDKNGNFYLNMSTGELKMKNGTFIGSINASKVEGTDISGSTIRGTDIVGGTITGETTINVGTDLTVGNNIYIGKNQSAETTFVKKIQMTEKDYISFYKRKTDGKGTIGITAQNSISLGSAQGGDGAADVILGQSGIFLQVQKDGIGNAQFIQVDTTGITMQAQKGYVSLYGKETFHIFSDGPILLNGSEVAVRSPTNIYNPLKILNGWQQEFYTANGNYVGKIQAMSHNGVGSIGIGIMADSGDNIFMGAGNTWYFVVSGGGSYSQPLNAYGNLDMHGWNIVNSSDERLKENIKDVDTNFIYNLEIKLFDYKDGNKNIIGIIANPYADKDYAKYFITQGIDGLYSVNYQNVNNALIQCVQEQKEKIDSLEERIEKLEKLKLSLENKGVI